jgi:hypothetical protein
MRQTSLGSIGFDVNQFVISIKRAYDFDPRSFVATYLLGGIEQVSSFRARVAQYKIAAIFQNRTEKCFGRRLLLCSWIRYDRYHWISRGDRSEQDYRDAQGERNPFHKAPPSSLHNRQKGNLRANLHNIKLNIDSVDATS